MATVQGDSKLVPNAYEIGLIVGRVAVVSTEVEHWTVRQERDDANVPVLDRRIA